jgi:XTP/dITP diphosphohydrolase
MEDCQLKLVLATHNSDKVLEFKTGLNHVNIDLLPLDQFCNIGEIEETGVTLKQNAKIKAETVFNITQTPTIADDTGLEVDALGGAPGVYSSRFSGENASYADNVKKLLKEMESIPIKNRTATFRTVICYRDKERELYTEGEIKGIITEKPKGHNGFGYDPIFYISKFNKTMAELTPEEKNTVSHRGNAIRNLRKLLKEIIQ